MVKQSFRFPAFLPDAMTVEGPDLNCRCDVVLRNHKDV